MRRILLYLLASVLVCSVNVHAEKKFTALGTGTMGVGLSPNGKYVVGVNPQLNAYGIYMESYLHNVETEETEWLTEYDEADYGKSGSFADVTDDGVIAGTFKDPEYTITVSDFDGDRTFPINVAAIWKEGQRTSLGFGDFEFSQFNYFEDGSFAEAISNDGKTVAGYIGIGNATYMFPCIWKQAENGKDWTFSRLKLPEGAVGGKAIDVSKDGNIIIGTIWFPTREVAAFWQNGECHLIEGVGEDSQYNEDFNYNAVSAVSPNGKYITFVFGRMVPCIYDVEQQSYRKVKTFGDPNSPDKLAVADNGNVVSAFGYGSLFSGEVYERPFWYSYQEDRTFGFDYFMSLFASGVTPPFTFMFEEKTKALPCGISADGTFILGNRNKMMSLGENPECWMLQTENLSITIPGTPDAPIASSLNLKEVTLAWNRDEQSYEKLTLESYNLYCEGEKIANVPAGDAETFTYVQKNVMPGYPKYSISCVYKISDSSTTLESPKSNLSTAIVPDTYALPFYDDFDSGSLETNYWEIQRHYGDMGDTSWGTIQYFGIADKGLYSSPMTLQPYSSALVSRPMDATKEKSVSLSFVILYGLLNTNDQQMDKDSLSIDVSVDRSNSWTEVKTMSFKDIPQKWNMQTADLSQWVAGKLFQVRLRKHGQGVAQYYYTIDLFKINTAPEKEAPTGLTGQITEAKKVNLIWKNELNAYPLNHINEYITYSLAVGNEGKEFIAANAFDAADLDLYKGKYLTSVSTMINHTDFGDSKDTHASIVIFENGQLVREQSMEHIIYNEYMTVVLDEPLAIDATKELKVGLKIFDYDERQIPIIYQNTLAFVPGKSDLYSEDGGKTWKKLSDYYATIEGQETSGYCCWDITANITDEATVNPDNITTDNNLLAYNVYRNGEKINSELIDRRQARFTDMTPSDHCYYEVVAYYFDGAVSETSDRYTIGSLTSVHSTSNDNLLKVYFDSSADRIYIQGEMDKITLFTVNGQVIKTTTEKTIPVSGLSAGVYFLRIESAGKTQIEKVMIK